MNTFKDTLEKCIADIIFYDKENAIEKIVKTVFESILKSERDEFLSGQIGNKGNGYYERMARSINKYFKLQVPRDRLGLFKPVFLEIVKQQENQIQDLAFQLYVKGLTTRDINNLLSEIYDKNLSPSSVSNITKEFQKQREYWQNRPLEKDYYFIYVDALFIPVRRDTVSKEAFYVVIGLKKDLKRDILGVYDIPMESSEGWREVFKDIKRRGVSNILMIIADGIQYLENVVREEFPRTKLQKCLVHKIRDILLKVRHDHKKEIAEDFRAVFRLEDKYYSIDDGRLNLIDFINKWKKIYPFIKNKFKSEHIENYFAYLSFPHQIQRMVYTTNWNERLNKGIRKTQSVRNSFPNVDSALNLVGAYLMDFEKRVYRYPVTSFIQIQDELDYMLEICHQTHKNV